MISDEEKRRIEDSITLAFEKHAYRKLSRMLNANQGAYQAEAKEDLFLQRRALCPAMHMHILGKRSKNSTIAKHRKVIVRAALNSLIEDTFTLADLDRGKDPGDWDPQSPDPGYTGRHTQRLIRERYGDVFFEGDSGRRRGSDGRTKEISTVFSGNGMPHTEKGDTALAMLGAARKAELHSEQLFLSSVLRFAFPQFLEDLLRFRDECRDVFENLGKRNDRINFLREQLTEVTPLLITLYSHLGAMLDVAWFRSIPADAQARLLKSGFKTRYDPSDARRAKEMLGRIYEPDKVVEIFTYCGTAFLRQKMTDLAIHMFEACLDVTGTDLGRGGVLQSMASAHRISQNYKLALHKMREALACFEKTGDVYRVCNAKQLIGESQWLLGHKDAATKSFEEVEMHGQKMEAGKRWLIHYILGMSFGRLGEWARRRRCLTKALVLMPDDYGVEGILRLNALIDDERPVYSDDILPPTIRQEIMNHMRQMPFLAPDASGKSVRPFRASDAAQDGKAGTGRPGARDGRDV